MRGRIIRPLLGAAERDSDLAAAAGTGLGRGTSTNQESEYSRNWLRNELLPAVEERLNAQAVRHIDQAGRRIRQADAYLEEVAEEWLQKHAPDGKADAKALAEQAEIVQGYIVRRLFLKSKMPPGRDGDACAGGSGTSAPGNRKEYFAAAWVPGGKIYMDFLKCARLVIQGKEKGFASGHPEWESFADAYFPL